MISDKVKEFLENAESSGGDKVTSWEFMFKAADALI
jgi:hypothetical protein